MAIGDWSSDVCSSDLHESATGVTTEQLQDDVFASTIQASLGDSPLDELDEAEIERSIREINEAIQRSSQRRR